MKLDKIRKISQDWWMFGIWVALWSAIVGWIISSIKFPALQLTAVSAPIEVKVSSASSALPAVGDFVVNFFTQFWKIPFAGWVGLAIGSVALVIIGRILYELIHEDFKAPFGKTTEFAKLSLVLLYGALAVSIILSFIGGFAQLTVAMLIAFLIYYIILALIVVGIARLAKFPQIPQ